MSEFDNFANEYNKVFNKTFSLIGSKREYFMNQKMLLSKRTIGIDPKNILDFGCGDGFSTKLLKNTFSNSLITGLDNSKKSVNEARSKNIENCTFDHYKEKKLPYENGAFDFIFVSCVLHHIEPIDLEQTLYELNRVLSPNGELHIYEHNPYNPFVRMLLSTCEFDKDINYINPRKLKSLLSRTNFKIIKLSFFNIIPKSWNFKLLIIIEHLLETFPLGGQYFIRSKKS
ncbi:class I SAM-dependent methyltransferase [Patescibacteria group bacterium]